MKYSSNGREMVNLELLFRVFGVRALKMKIWKEVNKLMFKEWQSKAYTTTKFPKVPIFGSFFGIIFTQ